MPLPRVSTSLLALAALLAGLAPLGAQAAVGTRDPAQTQDTAFARLYTQWTGKPKFGSPLVDHLPLVPGIPTPKDVLGYYIGQPRTLTYYADQLKYYRALAAATPRVRVETIGRSDEGRELVVVWVSSEEDKEALLAADPEVFFTTSHYDGHPIVLVHLDHVDLDEASELIIDSWRVRGPAKLVREWDAAHG